MIDFRLGVSVLLAVIVPTLVAKRWAADRLPEGVWAPTSGAVLAGVFAGRLLLLAVDHPSGLTAPLEVLSVRSGCGRSGKGDPGLQKNSTPLLTSTCTLPWCVERCSSMV